MQQTTLSHSPTCLFRTTQLLPNELLDGLLPLARLQRLHLGEHSTSLLMARQRMSAPAHTLARGCCPVGAGAAASSLLLLSRCSDFHGALKVEHVTAVSAACGGRLRHLALNTRAADIGSRAVSAIAECTGLSSLQLLNTAASTLSGPPAVSALRSMAALRWLSVQAAEDAQSQQPLELGTYIAEGLEGLNELRELRLWLGHGVEARMAEAALARAVGGELSACRVVALPEPEKPVL